MLTVRRAVTWVLATNPREHMLAGWGLVAAVLDGVLLAKSDQLVFAVGLKHSTAIAVVARELQRHDLTP